MQDTFDPFSELRDARAAIDHARERYLAAVVAAHERRGERSVNELADAAGVSRPRIYQLLAEARGESRSGRKAGPR